MNRLTSWINSISKKFKGDTCIYDAELHYRKIKAEEDQKIEDDAWERDIERCAIKAFEEYMKIPDIIIKEKNYKIAPIIFPLTKKVFYTIYDRDTAKFKDVNIHEVIKNRYRELLLTVKVSEMKTSRIVRKDNSLYIENAELSPNGSIIFTEEEKAEIEKILKETGKWINHIFRSTKIMNS